MRAVISVFNHELKEVFLLEFNNHADGKFIYLNQFVGLITLIDILIFLDDLACNLFEVLNVRSG